MQIEWAESAHRIYDVYLNDPWGSYMHWFQLVGDGVQGLTSPWLWTEHTAYVSVKMDGIMRDKIKWVRRVWLYIIVLFDIVWMAHQMCNKVLSSSRATASGTLHSNCHHHQPQACHNLPSTVTFHPKNGFPCYIDGLLGGFWTRKD